MSLGSTFTSTSHAYFHTPKRTSPRNVKPGMRYFLHNEFVFTEFGGVLPVEVHIATLKEGKAAAGKLTSCIKIEVSSQCRI